MSKSEKVQKLKNRSKKYSANLAKIKRASENRIFDSVDSALQTLLSLEKPNFEDGPSAELHIKLNINPTKSDQLVRSSVVLPNGTGKKVIVAAFVTPGKEETAKKAGADIVGGDELIERIKNDQKIDFDKAVAEPEMMKKLPVIARILGVAGVMPNPRNGTVGPNIEEMIKTIKAGKVDFKNDKTGNLHIAFGKLNSTFPVEKLKENLQAAIDAVLKSRPENVKGKFVKSLYISFTQSPSLQIKNSF